MDQVASTSINDGLDIVGWTMRELARRLDRPSGTIHAWAHRNTWPAPVIAWIAAVAAAREAVPACVVPSTHGAHAAGVPGANFPVLPQHLLARIGWSQGELARQLGRDAVQPVPRATVYNWGRRDSWPPRVIDWLAEMARAYDDVQAPRL